MLQNGSEPFHDRTAQVPNQAKAMCLSWPGGVFCSSASSGSCNLTRSPPAPKDVFVRSLIAQSFQHLRLQHFHVIHLTLDSARPT